MFAVIKSGGRQYKVSVGQKLEVNRLPVEVGKQVQFDEVLLISDAGNTMVGSPFVSDAIVLATAVEHARGEKLIVFKYKSKKRYRHRRGHRQELTVFTIDDIVSAGKSLVTGEAPALRSEEEEQDILENEPVAETPVAESEAEPEAQAPEAASSEEAETTEEKKPTRRRRVRKTGEDAEAEGEK
jgi:large subunit ribosomal protein L21